MEMKIPLVAISAFVVVVVLAAVLMPVLGDATTTEDTYTNEGYYYMQKISSDDAGTYKLSYLYDSGTFTFSYNDVEIDITSIGTLSTTLATDGETWVVRSAFNEYIGLQSVGPSFTSGGHNTKSSVYTFSQGTATVTAINTSDVTSTKTATYTDLWIYSPTPTEYVMKKSTSPAYLLDDSEYLAMGITSVTTWETIIKITGDVDDFDAEIVYPANVTTTVTNKEIHKEAVSGHVGLTSLDKLTFTISDGTSTVNATYSYFIVPAEVTAERSIHLTGNEIAILGAIPALVIVALLIGVLALYMRSRAE